MSHKPKVAVVIVNWNKKDDVMRLLNSLKYVDYENCDIIVVDNASTDGSVEAIREQFPEVELIINPENLGGTGGFNSGMRYALQKAEYQYIWLLDNDAEVEESTLEELINVMERDERIGIAGSRIIDSVNRDITVEAGAYLMRDSIGVQPLYRNIKNLNIASSVMEVDYVAICSALARTSALEKVGLMDERYFFFWDDMDWGLQFRDKGFKIISVLNSIVYHPAFTEKRGILVDYYYGNRNSLLTYAKHNGLAKRISIFYIYLRQKCTSLILLGLIGNGYTMNLGFEGIFDFVSGKWGKRTSSGRLDEAPGKQAELPGRAEKVLVLNDGSREEIYDALNCLLKVYPDSEYTLLISDDRTDLFDKGFRDLIKIDTKRPYSLFYCLSVFVNVLFKKFDISISFKNTSPFSYTTRKSYTFDSGTKSFYETYNNSKNIWKLILSAIVGETMGILLLPLLWVSSLKYKKT